MVMFKNTVQVTPPEHRVGCSGYFERRGELQELVDAGSTARTLFITSNLCHTSSSSKVTMHSSER